jgi:hypothetical protein
MKIIPTDTVLRDVTLAELTELTAAMRLGTLRPFKVIERRAGWATIELDDETQALAGKKIAGSSKRA